jgi:hypothetical protein
MGVFAESIAACGRINLGYARRLETDIGPESYARLPLIGDRLVQTNHMAFVYGHLALYPARLMELVEGDPADASYPEHWPDLFSPGRECQDDVDGSIYPPLVEMIEIFHRNYANAITAVAGQADELFARENPDERRRGFFPTIGVAATFLLNNHVQLHLGQVSAWRRAIGLGPAPM